MDKHDEVSIAHMTMIQGIVTRLETNSFDPFSFLFSFFTGWWLQYGKYIAGMASGCSCDALIVAINWGEFSRND